MHPKPSNRPVSPRDGGYQLGGHRGSGALPACRRTTDGEQRWPAALTVLTAIALQLVLPSRLGLHPKYLLPGLETALLIALVIANPGRFNARRRLLRAGGLVMIGLVIAANAVSAALLISDLLHSRGPTTNAGSLLTSAGDIYLTNIIAFGLLYWELDRRGPVARAHADIAHPDFMFPQMTKWAIRITAVVLNDRCRAMGGRVALRQGFRATPASSVETCSSGGGWGP